MFQTNAVLELNCTNLALVFKILFSYIGHCGKDGSHYDTSTVLTLCNSCNCLSKDLHET